MSDEAFEPWISYFCDGEGRTALLSHTNTPSNLMYFCSLSVELMSFFQRDRRAIIPPEELTQHVRTLDMFLSGQITPEQSAARGLLLVTFGFNPTGAIRLIANVKNDARLTALLQEVRH